MLKLFEKSAVFQTFVILAVTALLWLPHIADPQPMPAPAPFAPLYGLFYSFHFSPLLSVFLAMALVVIGGLILNLIIADSGLVAQNSLYPTLFYILFMSATSDTLTPTLFAGVLAIAFVKKLLIHGTPFTISSGKIFDATAMIGLCSLFYLPSLLLLLSYFLVAISYRLYGWRDWMLLLLGLLAPYLLLWLVLYFNGTLAESFPAMASSLAVDLSHFSFRFTLSVAANAVLLLFFAVSLYLFWRQFKEKTTLWQKNATAVIMPAVSAVALILYAPGIPLNLHFFAIPFALAASARFSATIRHQGFGRNRHQWKERFRDLLFLIVIAAAVIC